ncbi:acyl-CoA desaturase [Tengunoibacter tsumagoiensis]|uniref:Stearoyl-CoA 9-desaturase n=1 Tax=Tengunoibacter tsumagoiensis TaxID=2014871 RepID=A0A402A6T7_9CHLR|nr:acyl-CoA desaturase [Tengunoibacter tsumagoiensis]GCE14809.1 stearoyl-CoA 9-desaturase [Tengunoibacter tsumagoiensis]
MNYASPQYKALVLAVVVLPLLATVLAITLLWQRAVQPTDVILMLIMYALTAMGVTVGFHRMLTHRSFQPHPIVKFLFLVLGSMAIEGPPVQWAATHTKHHAQADREGDPHSPAEGFFHAHIGWMFKDLEADPQIYARHLLNDRMVMFVSRTFFIWGTLSLLIPFLIGGWNGLLWGGLVRIFLTHHVTWSVNSICHTFGKREFETPDRSRNEWLIGLLAFGEGWHNNHHAFPRSAFHGLHWWQVDFSSYIIWTLERLKLVKNVYRVTPVMMANRTGKRSA